MRKKLAAGNWKMNKTHLEAVELIEQLKELVKDTDSDVVLCVPAIDIISCVNAAKGSNIKIGAQNIYFKDSGAFTGEISADMVLAAGAAYTIIGHSERRQYFAETDETVNLKVKKAVEKGLVPIICCGETIELRERGITIDLVRQQIKAAYYQVSAEEALRTVIAYEPIWAIGTGKVATADQAEEVCKAIRECICELYGKDVSEALRILYGGSVTADNAAELFNMPDIDGGLVGGASLKTDFSKIANYNK
ncbi:MAG: triose-phosphate isomerase [Lachnospiraceae bacterium]|nr:triose-phosphate isomerase [Lachnospiraceae bacterium]